MSSASAAGSPARAAMRRSSDTAVMVSFQAMRVSPNVDSTLVAAVFLALAGCANEVVVVQGSGSGSSGTSGTGASASSSTGGGPHAITILVEEGSANLESAVAFQNRVDGSLVEIWSAVDLPVTAIVEDGDLVTFAYGKDGPGALFDTYVDSHRVTPVTTEVRGVLGYVPGPGCVMDPPTQVIVHVPAVPGANAARVMSARGGIVFVSGLPTDVPITAQTCAGDNLSILVTVFDENIYEPYVGAQYWGDVPPAPGGTVELTPTFESIPRKALELQVVGLDPSVEVHFSAHWNPTFALGVGLYDQENHFEEGPIPTPYLYSPKVLDLPPGYPFAWLDAVLPAPAGACSASLECSRRGRSDTPIVCDTVKFAQPEWDGQAWKLGPGEIGDSVNLQFEAGNAIWYLSEDPHFAPFPTVFPALPPFPAGLDAPTASPVLTRISHVRTSGVYTDEPSVQFTQHLRSVDYDCF